MIATPAMESSEMPPREGIKETLESIVIALILAFVFRAFIVEAFVIPTGSMAPTLYGAHGTILCEDCGVEFTYGLRDLDDPRRVELVGTHSKAVCPNCSHPNTRLKVNDERRNREKGDRILVLKWPLHLGLDSLGPKRWDVTVFKDPADGETNFIKRLVGLPNEVLMIADGDLYAVPTEKLTAKSLAVLEQLRREKYELRTGLRHGHLRRVPDGVLRELHEKMTLQPKPPSVQRALWFPVYDHDHPPKKLDPYQPRWTPNQPAQSGWETSRPLVRFEYRGVTADYIELTGKQIRASCTYNVHGRVAAPVSDLRVSLVWTPLDAEATLHVRLKKLGRMFWATFRAGGAVTLTESSDAPSISAAVMASARVAGFTPGGSVEISFANVDYRLAIGVRGEELLTSSDDPSSPAYYSPDLAALQKVRSGQLTRPRIYGEGGAFELRHLVVVRDAHYYYDGSARALAFPWAPRSGWGSQASPILLREQEYFMLGDNTAASKDSRLWDRVGSHLVDRGDAYQLGTVPRDQLIGKAFFVYWPSGYRLDWLPIPGLNRLGVIPDVGRMRWIR